MPTPFLIDVPQGKIEYFRERVRTFPWFPPPSDEGSTWRRGVNSHFFQSLCEYWLEEYDWRSREAELNRFPQYVENIDGLDIHFVHLVGEAGGKRPLILTHGWPGSHYEFWGVIEKLAFPSKFGGSSEDAFDVVVPSLPGFGFSGKPRVPVGPRMTARLWNELMTRVLAYPQYLAQGGDFGSIVTNYLGLDHDACIGIHLNMVAIQPQFQKPQNDEERRWMSQYQAATAVEGAYLMEHTTKPQTIAMALMDSPVGTAAWILEKIHGWTDLRGGELGDVLTKDQILTSIMIYLLNDAVATSIWYYRGHFEEVQSSWTLDRRVTKPTGIANFLREPVYKNPPRSWVDRMFNVVHWSDLNDGGHFAAFEQPDLFASDLREFGRKVQF